MSDPSPSLADDHALLCKAVRSAGAAVVKRFKTRGLKSWHKQDRSPVTEADLEANAILEEMLRAGARADYGWLSEESADDLQRLTARRVWIVDPIDGTRAFLEGRPEFAVCVALVEGTKAVASAIYNPITDEFFEATLGGGAFCNSAPIRASACDAVEQCRMLGWKHLFAHPQWLQPWPAMQVGYRNSTSYRMALVAKGEYDAALALLRKADWDVAPGALIASEAGAIASDHKGKEFRFNGVEPVQRALVCAAPGLYSQLVSRLNHLPADLREVTLSA
ncbi:3'(2'),5'-bisphosphate nucleotidase CysQ [Parvularcula sp. LCG005]|uniref:inositol monophosphatase family protein n=1 Tax=Parvularcula sp. LCG005 TaxID=3078805 RepID=UPI0029436994|nr:3'(2'),5'-bisphosphate nucleotidase CysQ [Parvularcula sp. LCG005]WOI53688.1 3'(2'),5'-bisphosphate nucleotidase CysQ [Parvularcula sp. LCG005]